MRFRNFQLPPVAYWTKQYANLPERFIKRKMEQIYWQTPKGDPRFLKTIVQREKFKFSMNRPWTREFFMDNYPGKKIVPELVEPIKDWSFFRGDRVEILVGRDKGKQGIVAQIFQESNWITVTGLNTRLKPMGKTKTFPGFIVLEEQPLLVTTQVALVDPADLKPCRIEWRYTDEGEKVRVSTRTGRLIPIPITSKETKDYKLPHLYKDQPKDTSREVLEEITFEPALKTFEMDIMDKMGIKEDRTPRKIFWY